MKVISSIKEFYGNKGLIFDLLLAGISIAIIIFLNISLSFISMLYDTKSDAVTTFLSILVGFLLTTFSLLFLYNPEHSENLMRVRKHIAYKKMLNTFISTSFFNIILCILFLLFGIIKNESIILTLAIFCIFRTFKCLYYLYEITSLV